MSDKGNAAAILWGRRFFMVEVADKAIATSY
jgi:hypothetical protein